jgi:acetyltransferase-like isoleucine patch superfamily enzyme
VDVGARVMFAHAASVVDGSHRFRDLSRPVNEQGYDVSPIHIGDDAAIMSKVTVIADVGERAFVAAGAVVTEPVPPFSVAAGVPARVIDYFGPPSRTPAT